MFARVLIGLLIAVAVLVLPGRAKEHQAGREIVDVGALAVVVYTYRPSPCANPQLMVLFAGHERDAERYRDRARGLAERACLLIVAPLLDRDRFPTWRYQAAGVSRREQIQPETKWTAPIIGKLLVWGRKWAGEPGVPLILFGHSAGAQLLSRFSAYTPPRDAARIVIANPSAYVFPSLKELAPYGFGGLFDLKTREMRLKDYLSLPITIYLGQSDTGDKLLVNDEAARRQGRNRYERGLAVFRAAEALCRKQAWPFGWRLVVVPGTGHSSRDMMDAPQVMEALGLSSR